MQGHALCCAPGELPVRVLEDERLRDHKEALLHILDSDARRDCLTAHPNFASHVHCARLRRLVVYIQKEKGDNLRVGRGVHCLRHRRSASHSIRCVVWGFGNHRAVCGVVTVQRLLPARRRAYERRGGHGRKHTVSGARVCALCCRLKRSACSVLDTSCLSTGW
jgi:hypothetical protein